jgi:anti-anti-sigma factor
MKEALIIRARHQPGYVLITVAGEIDIATAPQLRERLTALAASGRPLVVDLAQVSFLDAAGLGVLAGTAHRARARGTSLHVISARPQIRRLFAITGLDRHIPLVWTLAEALAELPPGWDIPVNGHCRTRARQARLDPGPPGTNGDMRPGRR